MGGFNPISNVLSLTGLYGGYSDTAGAYRAAKKQYDAAEKDIAAKSATEYEKLALESAEETRKRREALRRATAKQRATFAAQGIDMSDGSGEAVLLGLLKESEAERDYRGRLDALKRAAIDQDAAAKRRKNLLSLQGASSRARDSAVGTLASFLK